MNITKKHLLSFLLIIFVLSSCGGPLNKSIKEDLTEEELDQITKNEKDFSYYYNFYIQDGRRKLLSDYGETEWDKLTYKKLYKFYTKCYGSESSSEKEKEYGAEWQKIYNGYLPKIDSISRHYQKVKNDLSLERYMNVELTDVDSPYINEVRLIMKVTPLKGTIEKASFVVGIRDKTLKGDGVNDRNKVKINTPFSEPIIIQEHIVVLSEEVAIRRAYGAEEFMKRCNFTVSLRDIQKDGKAIDWFSYTESIPSEVKDLWKVENERDPSETSFQIAQSRIVQRLLGGALDTRSSYVSDKMQAIYLDYDKLAARFHKARY